MILTGKIALIVVGILSALTALTAMDSESKAGAGVCLLASVLAFSVLLVTSLRHRDQG